MIRITQIKLKMEHTEEDLKKQIAKLLRILEEDLVSYTILKKSIDARKKKDIFYVYNIEAKVADIGRAHV